MKKVFLIHGFEGDPNGGWRPWLMGELAKEDVYACALPMPSPYAPIATEWVEEVRRVAERDADDEIYLVGHSLGVTTILRYLETAAQPIAGAVLVSGPCNKTQNVTIHNFFATPFDYDSIRKNLGKVTVIHGDDDHLVPLTDAEILRDALDANLVVVPGGKHLNGSAGFTELKEAYVALREMMN